MSGKKNSRKRQTLNKNGNERGERAKEMTSNTQNEKERKNTEVK